MPEASRSGLLLAVLAVVGLLAAGGGALFLLAPGGPEEGPAEIAWDREVCAWCHMHLSEPAYAAQLRTQEGDLHAFDDPGCLFLWQAEHHADARGTWFHHVDEDRWIPAEEVGFVERSPTPMGYGLGAVGEQAATLSLSEARARALRQARGEREGGE